MQGEGGCRRVADRRGEVAGAAIPRGEVGGCGRDRGSSCGRCWRRGGGRVVVVWTSWGGGREVRLWIRRSLDSGSGDGLESLDGMGSNGKGKK